MGRVDVSIREVGFDGYESIAFPAGEFKDCLKATFRYINPSGSTRTEERPRSSAATEFEGRTAAYKLIDNLGGYQLYTFDPADGIQMHSSFESRPGGQILAYQPARRPGEEGSQETHAAHAQQP